MGEPAVAKTPTITESLEEIDRQMDELNIPAEDKKTGSEPAGSDTANQEEMSLNAEAPPDAETIQKLASGEMDKRAEEAQEGPPADPAMDIPGTERTAMEDDETGIDLGDDELWEDDDVEEIPLFEEEFLEQELETGADAADSGEEKTLEEKDMTAPAKETSGDTEAGKKEEETIPRTPADESEHTDSVPVPGDGPTTLDQPEEAHDSGETGDIPEEKGKSPGIRGFIPWIITGLSAGLCVAAIFTIWLIASGADGKPDSPPAAATQGRQQPVRSPSQVPGVSKVKPLRGTAQAIDLAPFLIPAQRSGDLVFFKLRVELITPDATTKQELLKREAWVRDVIYQELKGINISRGVKGDILTRYRRPLLKRLNRELAPLRLEDIRLMGFLLR